MNVPGSAIKFALLTSAVLFAAAVGAAAIAADDAWRAKPKSKPDASDEFFSRGEIPELRLEITPPELQKLHQDNRRYVPARLTENGKTTYADVGVKLKGAAGSFRGLDDRPALTLNTDKFANGQTFHGIDKFHLNNSVQDASYLHELICADLFLAAGVPTARATHARVWLNNRDLGFYVLKEGFDVTFLKRHFVDGTGNMYDGGFLQEIDGPLQKRSGTGPDDCSDLAELVKACRTQDAKERWRLVAERLNVDNVLSFMALEILTCHWDGYCRNRNNYRVYFDPTSKQAFFFPHGMDQMFGETGASIYDGGGALVAQIVMQNPEWSAKYRQRLRDLLPLFSPPDKLLKRVDAVAARIQPVLAKMHPDQAREHADRVRDFKNQLTARAANIQEQLKKEPVPLAFNAKGEAAIVEWYERFETDGAKFEKATADGKPRLLSIDTAQLDNCIASWRASVWLGPGSYKFQGRAKTRGIQPLESEQGRGAGLRISGGQRTNQLTGTADWTTLEFSFEVSGLQNVELVAELRATKGQVTFDANSLKLVKVAK